MQTPISEPQNDREAYIAKQREDGLSEKEIGALLRAGSGGVGLNSERGKALSKEFLALEVRGLVENLPSADRETGRKMKNGELPPALNPGDHWVSTEAIPPDPADDELL